MAITLAELKAADHDKVNVAVIDEFQKQSLLLDKMIFDDMANPVRFGSAWSYQYERLTTQASASTRAIGVEYAPSEAKTQRYTTDLAILGGSFTIDRAFIGTNAVIADIAFQFEQKRKAVIALFNDLIINGDKAGDANAFDGLNIALAGTSTELGTTAVTDLSTSAVITSNYVQFQDDFDAFLSMLDGKPTFLVMNSKAIGKFRAMARRVGAYSLTVNDLGIQVESYNGIPFLDLQEKPGSTTPVVGIATRTVGGVSTTGLTDIYAMRIGLDGFHALAPSTGNLIKTYSPNLTEPGVTRKGELEMITGCALKATKAAGVYRNIKVQ